VIYVQVSWFIYLSTAIRRNLISGVQRFLIVKKKIEFSWLFGRHGVSSFKEVPFQSLFSTSGKMRKIILT
jgi:hypothetical protein